MGESKPGFILGLIGGIIGILVGILMMTLGGAFFAFLEEMTALVGGLYMGLGIWYLITGALVIWFSTWMKDPKKCRLGGIWTLVFSVIGSGGILGLVGGILGIVQGGK